jgi:GNAT superfamily N-acetyltransferase
MRQDAPAISTLAAEVLSLHAAAHPDLFKRGGAGIFPPDTICERMATPGHEFLVAIDDGRVVGYAYLITTHELETPWRHASSVLTVDQMAVTEPLRGRGAGTALLDAARARRAAIGASECVSPSGHSTHGPVRSTSDTGSLPTRNGCGSGCDGRWKT